MTTWCNGIVESLILDVADRGLMLGDGVFETVLVLAGRPVWLSDHLTRMTAAADEMGIRVDQAAIGAGTAAVLERSTANSEILRITLTRGPTPRGFAAQGLKPTVIVSLNPFDRAKLPLSVKLQTSQIRRNEFAPSSRLKTLSYIDAIAAAREVAGMADDALMLNTAGHVACTTIANVFLLKGHVLTTPSDDQGILSGITRQKLIGGAATLGLKMAVRRVHPNEIMTADCVFLTNSLRLATPVGSVDGHGTDQRDIGFIQDYLSSQLQGDAL